MTREKAIELFKKDKNSYGCYKAVITKIKQIYNDFESRTCENCKYYNKKDNICNRKEIIMLLPKNFGCNKFETKDKELLDV